MFKIFGLIAGYYFAGIAGALPGFIAGWFIDRIRSYGTGGANPLHNRLRQTVFLETLFIAAGRLAKTDGRVSEAEIAHTEALIEQLGMSTEQRAQAIALFKRGVDLETDLAAVCARFMSVCGQTHDLREVMLSFLITLALADSHLHQSEEALLGDIATRLGYDEAAFRQMLEMVLNQAHFAEGQHDDGHALEEAYKALGVRPENSDGEIKRAYRKLMSQYHPDKLTGQGLPAEVIALATEKTKEIQLAYDLIQKSRAG